MLLRAPSVSGLFKWRQFEPEVILLAVGWYLRFSLSYRDVEELLGERGLSVDHVTVWRWLNSNKGTKRDMAISLIPFDRLDFRTLGYPQNGAPFSPPILGVEFRCCLAASRLLVREVILAEQVEVLPGNRRAMGHRVEKRLPAGGILDLF